MAAYIVSAINDDVYCYGELTDTSNFSVVCDDEEDDAIWCMGNPTADYFENWEEVVRVLQKYFKSQIQEISAV